MELMYHPSLLKATNYILRNFYKKKNLGRLLCFSLFFILIINPKAR
jgi:hypothetical protein